MLPRSMLEEALETLVRRATEADGGLDLAAAREAFHARTGEIAPGDPDYEQRIAFFLDWYLCAWISPDGTRPGERAARTELEREVAGACARAARGLYEVVEVEEDGVRLSDRLGGGRFRVAHASARTGQLRAGDVFDGHLIVVGERIALLAGLVFHPAEAREALEELLSRVRREGPRDRVAILDGLSRMRMRLDRFASMRARHIYRWEALADREILSAAWARKSGDHA
ncbi:MAG: hypothetical protein M5U28_17440 [Sandaracinaceae bacterium]|nr:hypothetical protein [Sandaracinaceae bacterium]